MRKIFSCLDYHVILAVIAFTMDKFQLEKRLIDFAVGVISLTQTLEGDLPGQYFGHQLLRSGGSPALHYGEALGAESTKDFIHKMSIGVKELRESYNNLRIIRKAHLSQQHVLIEKLISECNELISIFVAASKARLNATQSAKS